MDNLSGNAQQALAALTELGQGTVAQIREKTGKAKSTTDKAIRELADAGLIVESDPGDGRPASWSIADTDPDSQEPGADEQFDAERDGAEPFEADVRGDQPTVGDGNHETGGDDSADESTSDSGDEKSGNTDAEAGQLTDDKQPGDDEQPSDEDQPGDEDQSGDEDDKQAAPTAAIRPADRRVLAVRGVLGDYPDGATVEEIIDATGYNIAIVTRLLQAMEHGDAARRIAHDGETGSPLRWIPGPGKASEIDPNPAPARCGTCGQVLRGSTPKVTGVKALGSATGTVNGDGSEQLGRNVLRGWVLEFINGRPGHVFTPQTIADELGAQHNRTISSGAVRNNCTTLAADKQIRLASTSPLSFTANQPAAHDGTQQ